MKNADSPAMPQSVSHSSYDGQITASYDFEGGEGLTKREHFAAMALNTILNSYNPYESGDFDSSEWDVTAKNAVGLADALLKALENSDV